MAHLLDMNTNNIIYIKTSQFSIGRARENSVVIFALPISRVHCVLQDDHGQWTLADKSSNGTRLNEVLLKGVTAAINNGDVIQLTDDLKYKFLLPQCDNETKIETIEISDNSVVVIDEVGDEKTKASNEVEMVNVDESVSNDVDESVSNDVDEILDELQCSVCMELFIEPMTLQCSHTFCKFCIQEWQKKNNFCPICRKVIVNKVFTIVINKLISKYLETVSDEIKQHRQQLVEQRKPITEPVKEEQKNVQIVVDISSDSESDSEVSADDYWDDEYEPYNGIAGAYYGGYGYCYSCGDRGHWAPGCPFA